MESLYDKLGELLNESIKRGFIQKEKPNFPEKSEKKTENAKTKPKNDNFIPKNDFSAIKIKHKPSDEKLMHALKILCADENDSFEAIQKKYRNLLKKYHPDSIPDFPIMQKTAKTKTNQIIESFEYIKQQLFSTPDSKKKKK